MADLSTLQPGDLVVSWRGGNGEPSKPFKVERVTATQIIDEHGARWKKKDGRRIGASLYLTEPWLHRADDPTIREAKDRLEAEARRINLADEVDSAANRWARSPDEKSVARLRAAVVALAPHLGLTVTPTEN